MKRNVFALAVGMLLGGAVTWFITARLQAEMDAPSVSALPDLPAPYYRVLFENDSVRIVDHQLDPGEIEPEHTHAPMVGYFVEGATLMVTEADGSASETTIPTGAFVEANNLQWWTHALENTGRTRLHSILVELKQDRPRNTAD